jgi:hypothetical protein
MGASRPSGSRWHSVQSVGLLRCRRRVWGAIPTKFKAFTLVTDLHPSSLRLRSAKGQAEVVRGSARSARGRDFVPLQIPGSVAASGDRLSSPKLSPSESVTRCLAPRKGTSNRHLEPTQVPIALLDGLSVAGAVRARTVFGRCSPDEIRLPHRLAVPLEIELEAVGVPQP